MPMGESPWTPIAACTKDVCTCTKKLVDRFSNAILPGSALPHIHRLPAIATVSAMESAKMLDVGVVRLAGDMAVSDLLVKSKLKPRSVLL